MVKSREIIVVYDEECPFCKHYCKLIKLKKTVGTITLVDAREPSPVMDEITALNLDIDQGMVVKLDDRIYFGSDAVHILSLLSSNSDFFNRINYMLFSSQRVTSMLYPVLRACRNFSLWLLNIKKINNLKGVKNYEGN